MSWLTTAQGLSASRIWLLDETSGTTAADSSGNAGDGAYSPNAAGSWTGGTLGSNGILTGEKAASFNGTTGYVSCGTTTDLDFAGSYTIECWVKLTAAKATAYQSLIGRWHDSGGRSQLLAFGRTDTIDGAVFFHDNGATKVCASTDAESTYVGAWVHLVGVYDSVGQTMKLYRDGALNNTTTSVAAATTGTGLDWQLGDHTDGTAPFGGLLYRCAVYPSALSGANVAALYAAGSPSAPSAPTWLTPAIDNVTTTSVDLHFDDGGDTSITSFTVEISTDNTFATVDRTITLDPEDTTATITPALATTTTYYVRIKATNIAGDSSWSTTESFETPAPSTGRNSRLSLGLSLGL